MIPKIFEESFVLPNLSTTEDRVQYLRLESAEKSFLARKLVELKFKRIKNKYKRNDYNLIEKTFGDITKLKEYGTLVTGIDMLKQSKDKDALEVVKAFNYVKTYKQDFYQSFKSNNEFMIMLYCTIVMSIVRTTTYLLAGCDTKRVKIAKPFKFVSYFNDMVVKGKLDVLSNSTNTAGKATNSFVGVGIAILVVLAGAIIMVRTVVYYFYYTQANIEGSLNDLASVIDDNLKSVNDKETKTKQEKIRDKLSDLANKFDIETAETNKTTDRELDREDKQDGDTGTLQQSDDDDDDLGDLI